MNYNNYNLPTFHCTTKAWEWGGAFLIRHCFISALRLSKQEEKKANKCLYLKAFGFFSDPLLLHTQEKPKG